MQQAAPAAATKDINQLVVGAEPMVRTIALSIFHNRPFVLPLEDLIQEGMVAASTCAHRFDPSLGVSFQSYAKHRVRGSMLEFYRDKKVYYEVAIELDDDSSFIDKLVADPISHARIETNCMLSKVWALIEEMPERERTILMLAFKDGYSQVEIGKALGISNSRICQIVSKAVDRIRTALDFPAVTPIPLPKLPAEASQSAQSDKSDMLAAAGRTEPAKSATDDVWNDVEAWHVEQLHSPSLARLRDRTKALLAQSPRRRPRPKGELENSPHKHAPMDALLGSSVNVVSHFAFAIKVTAAVACMT